VLLARAGQFLATVARHAVPLGGLFGRDWHPVTALGVYWLESVLLVLAAAGLCVLIQRRISADAASALAREGGDGPATRAVAAERAALVAAHISPKFVLLFHLGSLGIFGAFLAGIVFIMIGNGHLAEPVRWGELGEGAEAMLIVVAIGFTMDLWAFRQWTVADVQARVDACMVRWALLWMLGFFGTALMVFTGRPTFFFGFFAGLKVLFESWARLARMFGWRSLKDREADAAKSV
jgi:hypothetical protein